MIDRVGPTSRPRNAVRGYQRWRSLLFMHWPIPVEVMRPLVPASLELDLHEGTAYVGVVPFEMQGVRPRWAPERLAFSFLEANVRTYVCHGDQPGVYFFSLEAANQLAVWTARKFWGLPYHHAKMSMECRGDETHFESCRRGSGHRLEVRYRLGEILGPSRPGSLEFFFLERYLLFVERHGTTYVGRVHHSPYPAQRAEILEARDELTEATGLGPRTAPPQYAHYAAGVDVEVFGLCRAGT